MPCNQEICLERFRLFVEALQWKQVMLIGSTLTAHDLAQSYSNSKTRANCGLITRKCIALNQSRRGIGLTVGLSARLRFAIYAPSEAYASHFQARSGARKRGI